MQKNRICALFSAAFLLLAAWTPGQAQARAGSIYGTISDAETNLALAGAVVRIESLGRSVVSGQNGRFVLTMISAGSHEVQVTYMGYATATEIVVVAATGSIAADFRLHPGAIGIEGVTVVGQRSGQARALNQQLNSPNITNVVAADQIGRFPDANIGDAIKRIPGITVTTDQGEARFGLIRGTEPRLNSVMVNGERIPSAEAEVREVQLDLIPADMVSAVEVTKALMPDMDADAIGGSVNIVTRAAPLGRRVSATLGSGYNYLAGQPMGIASGVISDRFADGRLGVILSGSYFNHQLGSDNIEAVWDRASTGQAFVEEFDIRQYEVQRVRRSMGAAVDYHFSPTSTVTLRSMYNWRDDWENRYRLRYVLRAPDASGVQITEIRRQTKGGIDNDRVRNTRLEDQRVQNHSLSGEHWLAGGYRLSWGGSVASASEHRPDERYIEWRARNVRMAADYGDPRKPAFAPVSAASAAPEAFTFRRMENLQSWTRDRDMNGRVDFLLPLRAVGDRTNLKFGTRIRLKDKLRDNSHDFVTPKSAWSSLTATDNSDRSDAGYLAGDYRVGTFTDRTFLGRLDFDDTGRFARVDQPEEYLPGNYDATEHIAAGYAMLDHAITPRLGLIAGVRVENSRIDYNGFELDIDDYSVAATAGSDRYTNILPSVHLRYEAGPRTVVRAAWTNTLSRPNYYDLVPYRVVSFDDDELEMGNPDLDATTSMNFDLMAERYFQSLGLISAGAFYKDINDFIFTYSLRNEIDPVSGRQFSSITRPQNGGRADLWGFEVAFQRQLDFLPGLLSSLGVYTNYTFTDSRVKGLNIAGRETESLALPGTSRHTGNASLSYDTRRLSLRGSMNFQDSFIDPGALGDDAFFDRHYDRAVHVDANASLTITPSARLFIEANNLTNQPLRYFQGTRERMMQEEFYDRRFSFGLKYDM